ncbi:hypothetical protein Pure05_25880 [Paenarthrobacter ureafaciens]|nr:hypothetical protein Pure01_25900 [Paenarthrobacter ureafaciens]GLU64507.1 hypothetical protein Pure02_27570 [Paenarthrobacter ureafaciens]GLU68621.1 hypothetical protein Pure03_25970 [Paenarthrobacter ureafaciens]GLU73044.1 hypothetical protein Pure04_27590 [Paenarthrobacter ureafaciens]GLU77148.1 hypothetical protein Pure05_25880 [Paenarthrobacter ureafaciens]
MARIIPLISTAWAWWGIIACANIASAALWSPALAGADGAGALEEPIFPWSIPGMDVPDEPGVPVLHPASAREATRATAERGKSFLVFTEQSFKRVLVNAKALTAKRDM